MTNILKKFREESAGRMSAMAAAAIVLIVSLAFLTTMTRWTEAFSSPSYQQDGSPLLVSGTSVAGSPDNLNALDDIAYEVRGSNVTDSLYWLEVRHNSTHISYAGALKSVNVTMRFSGDRPDGWNLTIYNWAQGNWMACMEGHVNASAWAVWYCNITDLDFAAADFVSADGVVRISIASSPDAVPNTLREDYVSFNPTYDAMPKWANEAASIVAAYSPTEASHFYMSWTDDAGISETTFESNYSGIPENYTMEHAGGNTYEFGAILPAGTYYWRSYAMDTNGQVNASIQRGFSVVKAQGPAITLYVNSASPNQESSITYGVLTNVTATTLQAASLTIYRNGTIAASATGTSLTYLDILDSAAYNLTAVAEGNANYKPSSIMALQTVNKAPVSVALLLNGTDGSRQYQSRQQANFTAVANVAGKTVSLAANITGWSLQSGTGSVTNITNMSTGFYNVTAYFAGDQNYLAGSSTHFADVRPYMEASTSPSTIRREQDYRFSIAAYMSARDGDCSDVNATLNAPSMALVEGSRKQEFGYSVSDVRNAAVWYLTIPVTGTHAINVTWDSSDCGRSTTPSSYATITPYVQPPQASVIFSSNTEYKSGETITQVVLFTLSNGTLISGGACLIDVYNSSFLKDVNNASMTEITATGLYQYQNSSLAAEGIYTSWVNCTYGIDSAYASKTFHIAPWANAITAIDTRSAQLQNTLGSGNGAVTIWNLTQQANLTAQEINRTVAEINRTLGQLNDSMRVTLVPKMDLALGNLTEIRALSIAINDTVQRILNGSYSLATLTDEIRLNRDQIASLRAKLDKEAEFSKESVFLVTDSVSSVNDALKQIEAGNIATARLSLDTAAKSMAKAAEAYELESAVSTRRMPAGGADIRNAQVAATTTGLTGSYSSFLSKTKLMQVAQVLAYIIVSALFGAAFLRKKMMKPLGKGKKKKAKKHAFDYILPYISPDGWRRIGGSLGLGLLGWTSSQQPARSKPGVGKRRYSTTTGRKKRSG